METVSKSLQKNMVSDRGLSDAHYPADGHAFLQEIEEKSFWFRHRFSVLHTLMRKFVPELPILDIGGGNGYTCKRLQDVGIPCTLLEPDDHAVEYASRRGVEHIVHASLASACLPDHSMASVCCLDVLEHTDDAAFLRQLRLSMKDGAYLYISVPAYSWLWSQEDIHAMHRRRYTLTSLKTVLAASGFSVKYGTYLFAPLPLPIVLLRTIPSAMCLKREWKKTDYVSRNVFLDRWLRYELHRIEHGKTVPFGSSCFVVAQAIT